MHLIKILISRLLILLLISAGCTKDSNQSASQADTGKGGSLARFTIAANHLYIVDYGTIEVYDLADPANPVKKTSVNIGFGVETIYTFQDKLFIGSRDGMYIYSIANPSDPVKLGEARHVRSCDPVVANDTAAYVTLQGGSACGPAQSGLYVYDIKNITAPVQKSLLPLSTPYGLGLKDSVVFVCRGNSGLSLIDVKDLSHPVLMHTITDGDYRDVIPYNNILIAYVSTGLLIYDISDLKKITKIGTVNY